MDENSVYLPLAAFSSLVLFVRAIRGRSWGWAVATGLVLAVDAVLNRDGPVIFGTVLFSAAAVVVATFTLDIVDVLLDPRLRSR